MLTFVHSPLSSPKLLGAPLPPNVKTALIRVSCFLGALAAVAGVIWVSTARRPTKPANS